MLLQKKKIKNRWFPFSSAIIFTSLIFTICNYGSAFAQTITERSALSFPSLPSNTTAINLVTNPSDSDAAVFDANGTANQPITVTTKESFIWLRSGNQKIMIQDFTFGGSVTDIGGSGTGSFDISGNLTNIRVGATVVIPASPVPGSYTGILTFKLVYN